jgi:hypothetical protein
MKAPPPTLTWLAHRMKNEARSGAWDACCPAGRSATRSPWGLDELAAGPASGRVELELDLAHVHRGARSRRLAASIALNAISADCDHPVICTPVDQIAPRGGRLTGLERCRRRIGECRLYAFATASPSSARRLLVVPSDRLWRPSRDARMCLASVVGAGVIELPRRLDSRNAAARTNAAPTRGSPAGQRP